MHLSDYAFFDLFCQHLVVPVGQALADRTGDAERIFELIPGQGSEPVIPSRRYRKYQLSIPSCRQAAPGHRALLRQIRTAGPHRHLL